MFQQIENVSLFANACVILGVVREQTFTFADIENKNEKQILTCLLALCRQAVAFGIQPCQTVRQDMISEGLLPDDPAQEHVEGGGAEAHSYTPSSLQLERLGEVNKETEDEEHELKSPSSSSSASGEGDENGDTTQEETSESTETEMVIELSQQQQQDYIIELGAWISQLLHNAHVQQSQQSDLTHNAHDTAIIDTIQTKTYKNTETGISVFIEGLQDGHRLCEIVRTVHPRSLPTWNRHPTKVSQAIENIMLFTHAVKRLGINTVTLQHSDLTLEHIDRVITCLLALAKHGYMVYGRPAPPSVVQMVQAEAAQGIQKPRATLKLTANDLTLLQAQLQATGAAGSDNDPNDADDDEEKGGTDTKLNVLTSSILNQYDNDAQNNDEDDDSDEQAMTCEGHEYDMLYCNGMCQIQ